MERYKHIAYNNATGAKGILICSLLESKDDKEYCLFVETDSLPQMVQDRLDEVVKSPAGQKANELLAVLSRNNLPDGQIILDYLHYNKRIARVETNKINVQLSSNQLIKVSELNKILQTSDNDLSKEKNMQTEKVETESAYMHKSNLTADEKQKRKGIAMNMVKQAELLSYDIKQLVNKAVEMDNDLEFNRTIKEIFKYTFKDVFNSNEVKLVDTKLTEVIIPPIKDEPVNENISSPLKENIGGKEKKGKTTKQTSKFKKDGTLKKKPGRKTS